MAATDMFDCYLEPVPELGFVTRRRPCLIPFSDVDTGKPGDGIYWWDAAKKCIAVSNGRVFEIKQDGSYVDITSATCNAGVNAVFADGQALDGTPWLYIATGKLVYSINGGNTTASDNADAIAVTTAAVAATKAILKLAEDALASAQVVLIAAQAAYAINPTDENLTALTNATQDVATAAINISSAKAAYNAAVDRSNQIIAGTTSPPATHVAWIDGRFVANISGTPRFEATDTNPINGELENDFWQSTINPFRNTARGDNIAALLTCWEEIYVWGSEALEVWQNDYSTPFVPIASALSEIGLEAPYSICRTENTLFAVCVKDGKRVIVKMQGRAPVIISEPIANILSDMNTVSDAIGDLISVGGINLYMLSFPSENQTWVYDTKTDVWSRWGRYMGEANERDQFIGQHVCFCKAWNKYLIQSRIDGQIYQLSRDVFNDAGEPVIPYRRTGNLDISVPSAPSYRRKRCDQLLFRAKPGLTDEVRVMMRYQDDGRGVWSDFTELVFDETMVERLTRQGTFMTRRYEFRIPADIDCVLISALGAFTELRN